MSYYWSLLHHVKHSCVIVQEVFKTEQSHEIAMSQIMGRCYVMFVKDYFKMRPEVIINDNNSGVVPDPVKMCELMALYIISINMTIKKMFLKDKYCKCIHQHSSISHSTTHNDYTLPSTHTHTHYTHTHTR